MVVGVETRHGGRLDFFCERIDDAFDSCMARGKIGRSADSFQFARSFLPPRAAFARHDDATFVAALLPLTEYVLQRLKHTASTTIGARIGRGICSNSLLLKRIL